MDYAAFSSNDSTYKRKKMTNSATTKNTEKTSQHTKQSTSQYTLQKKKEHALKVTIQYTGEDASVPGAHKLISVTAWITPESEEYMPCMASDPLNQDHHEHTHAPLEHEHHEHPHAQLEREHDVLAPHRPPQPQLCKDRQAPRHI